MWCFTTRRSSNPHPSIPKKTTKRRNRAFQFLIFSQRHSRVILLPSTGSCWRAAGSCSPQHATTAKFEFWSQFIGEVNDLLVVLRPISVESLKKCNWIWGVPRMESIVLKGSKIHATWTRGRFATSGFFLRRMWSSAHLVEGMVLTMTSWSMKLDRNGPDWIVLITIAIYAATIWVYIRDWLQTIP